MGSMTPTSNANRARLRRARRIFGLCRDCGHDARTLDGLRAYVRCVDCAQVAADSNRAHFARRRETGHAA